MNTDQDLKRAFHMPKARNITFRTSTITNAFVAAITPFVPPKPSEIGEVLNILGIDPDRLTCAYCGDPESEWEHLHALVRKRRPSDYPSSIRNLVPSCGKCNQSKSGEKWSDWIISNAKLSPKSRKKPNLEDRIVRLKKYEQWANCRPMNLEGAIGKELYDEYFRKLDSIIEQMREAEIMAKSIKAKVPKDGS